MKASGLIVQTKRGPFLSPIQLAPKSSTESRFILDASHLTPHLHAPPFRLDPLPKVLLQVPLPPSPYFAKVDLAEAFYHVTLHPQARRLTTFRLDGIYYEFTRMPFGIRPAPFIMQNLATAFARTLRSEGLWAWAYVDNVLIAHSDPDFLQEAVLDFVDRLTECGFRINPKDTCLVPTRRIKFLGFCLDTSNNTLSHTPQRVQALRDTLRLLETPQPQQLYRRPRQAAPPPPKKWCRVIQKLWDVLPHSVPFVPIPPVHTMYADASSTGLAVVTPTAALAVITLPSPRIYLREAMAWLLAALLADPATLIHTDNLALRQAITAGHAVVEKGIGVFADRGLAVCTRQEKFSASAKDFYNDGFKTRLGTNIPTSTRVVPVDNDQIQKHYGATAAPEKHQISHLDTAQVG
ncbi:hypothetical protein HPB47_006065 [Ixodes persulcatus]|uniref:Uncharacterized protein n=1 Tax=Ixodes persulcatus TaxID=34615 RepID=A0AC60PBB8_IXOPE|nr:hypothetical protein HPB47_006065 [Ixodes persulcatus]